MRKIKTELVRVKLSGVSFDMPINYMYSEAMETYNRWPKPKKNSVEAKSISLSVSLPDLPPPYQSQDGSGWRTLGYGDRIELSIASLPKGRRVSANVDGFKIKKPDSFAPLAFSSPDSF